MSTQVREVDSKGRLTLGKEKAGRQFQIEELDGRLILTPVVTIPARESWLHANPEAMASVMRGLQQSAAGERRYLGSFAHFADDDID
ncbi:MAG TPA: hypothetical protein VFJ58_18700 [Armatimonadota bacterium]|nr:hypothetical protein [Armatimonadota bacterium]